MVDGTKPRCARREGFSLHANVSVPAHARARLEHLCRYLLRPPLALERLTESSRGQLVFELPHPRPDGATHLLLDPLELMEKLTLLIPPPRFHTLRFHGVLAPAAAWRSAVIPGRPEAEKEGPPAAVGAPRERGSLWAALLRRVFAIDVFACPRCGGRRRLVGVFSGGGPLRAVLERLGLARASVAAEPARAPPRRDPSPNASRRLSRLWARRIRTARRGLPAGFRVVRAGPGVCRPGAEGSPSRRRSERGILGRQPLGP
jgi:hypothetical protein